MTLTTEESTGSALFARVLAGVDGSEAGLDAAVQAGRLVADDGELELATAIYLVDANLQHWPREQVEATLELEGAPRLQAAAAKVGRPAATRLLNGPAKQALLEEAERFDASLIVVGSHGHSRLSELLIGGVAGPLLRDAPCSVLIARPAIGEARFPTSVVVGIDGSPGSLEALAVAEHLGARFGATVQALKIVEGSAVHALVDVSAASDLVVVGSRGLHGLSALGSVSGRVAQKADSSVLVVRTRR